jgi:hypothetical protein
MSIFLKICYTVHGHIFCMPCRVAGSHVCSLYEVSMSSRLFSIWSVHVFTFILYMKCPCLHVDSLFEMFMSSRLFSIWSVHVFTSVLYMKCPCLHVCSLYEVSMSSRLFSIRSVHVFTSILYMKCPCLHVYSLYEVSMSSRLFSSWSIHSSRIFSKWSANVSIFIFVCLNVAVQVECFVDLIKLAIVFRVTIRTQLRQVTDYMRVLRLSPLLCANNTQPFAHGRKTSKKILLCVFVPFRISKHKLHKPGCYFEGRSHVS